MNLQVSRQPCDLEPPQGLGTSRRDQIERTSI